MSLFLVGFAVSLGSSYASAQQERVLYSFGSSGTDGSHPYGGVVVDSAGNLYGTTREGGSYGYGTVFEISPHAEGTWTESILHNFNNNGVDGFYPHAGLVADAAGNLYGTTTYGGAYRNCGAVFEMQKKSGGWSEAVIHSFTSEDGQFPEDGLIFDGAGNLYGTTKFGGTLGNGAVFKLSPALGGNWQTAVLHSFGAAKDGFYPVAGLAIDTSGHLYGTTTQSSANDDATGAVFELKPTPEGNWLEAILLTLANDGYTLLDGTPEAGVVLDSSGNLYGTAFDKGGFGFGEVFEVRPGGEMDWPGDVLFSFYGGRGIDNSGGAPMGGLTFDTSGSLYGTGSAGGSYHNHSGSVGGVVFKLTPQADGPWSYEVVHSFGSGSDGSTPYSGVVFDASGNLYGTTLKGGTYNAGTVYEVTP
jgi:uncharacterized repeat protein (TIGR03803 family)